MSRESKKFLAMILGVLLALGGCASSNTESGQSESRPPRGTPPGVTRWGFCFLIHIVAVAPFCSCERGTSSALVTAGKRRLCTTVLKRTCP